MKDTYIDFPENMGENVIEKLSKAYKERKVSPLSFFESINKEKNMEKTKILQEEEIQQNATNMQQNYKLYSLISSNYCNLINLIDKLLAKTSSSKKEIYQTINAQLRVDSNQFNNTFNTVCDIEPYNYCNYNQLVYTIIIKWIDLTQNLTSLDNLTLTDAEKNLLATLIPSAFELFRTFINAHPIRY